MPERRDGRVAAPAVVAAIAVVMLAGVLRFSRLSDAEPTWDERDYRQATLDGFSAIYWGTTMVSFPHIVARAESEPGFRDHPWADLAAGRDNLAVRHFHNPLAFYPAALLGRWTTSALVARVPSSIAVVVCVGWVVLSCAQLSTGWIGGLLAALFIAVDPRLMAASVELTPHPFYISLALAALLATGAWLERPSPHRLTGVGLLLGTAAATMELAPVLVAAIGTAAIVHAGGIRPLRPYLVGWRRAFAAFAGALVLAWPAGVFKLGYITAYGAFIGQALFRREEYFGAASVGSLYERLFGANPLWITAVAITIVLAILSWRLVRASGLFVASGTYAFFSLGVNWLNRFRNVTYAAEVMPFFWLLLGATLGVLVMRSQRTARPAAAGLMLILGTAALAAGLGIGA